MELETWRQLRPASKCGFVTHSGGCKQGACQEPMLLIVRNAAVVAQTRARQVKFCLSLSKHQRPTLQGGHFGRLGRGETPAVQAGEVYRCWASIRARQVLKWIRDFIPEGSLGFMPGREASEAWYVLEGLIECAVQDARIWH